VVEIGEVTYSMRCQILWGKGTNPSFWGSIRAITDVVLQVEPPFMPAVSWANFNPGGKGGIILKTIYEQPRRLTREQANDLSLEDIQLILVESIAKSGQLLVEHSEEVLQDSSTPPGARLKVGIVASLDWRYIQAFFDSGNPVSLHQIFVDLFL